jgi:hypothetical protein
MDLFCVRLETQCPCKIGCMLRSLRESDKQEKAFLELTYGENNIFSGLRSGRENQKASRLQGGSDRRLQAAEGRPTSHADKGTKGFVQCLANTMASVGALPIKCHEPMVMALAGSVTIAWPLW